MTETSSEINAAGYTDLDIGTLIRDRWLYLEFRDAVGGKITRLRTYGTGADTRITPVVAADKKSVAYTCAFTGSETTDPDIAAYMVANSGVCTFKYAVLKNANTDGDTDLMATDDFTTATIADAADTLTITVSAGVGV